MRIGWLAAVSLTFLGCGSAPIPPRQPLSSPSTALPTALPTSLPTALPPPPTQGPESAPTAVAAMEPAVVDQRVVEQSELAPCAAHPAPNPLAYLKGQVHVHSERSFDAATAVPDVIGFFAERGYDFLSITDHNHVTIPKDHASGILLIPGVELTYNATVCDPPPRPGYLCAFHTNVLFLNPLRDATRGKHFVLPFRKSRLEVFQILQHRSDDLEGMLVLNHPTYHYAVDEAMLDELLGRGIRFVEFFNGAVMDHNEDGPEAEIEKSEQLWDAMLTRGHRVLAVGADDAHHFADAATIRMTGKQPLYGNRSWIMVRSERTPEAIRQAMVDGDYYVSTGVGLRNVLLSETSVHVSIDAKEGESYVTRFVGDGGHILARVEGAEACYPVTGSEGYVRAVVENDKGKYAWTQAVMLPRSGRSP